MRLSSWQWPVALLALTLLLGTSTGAATPYKNAGQASPPKYTGPLPLYNLPIHGQSMYNNYDPFIRNVKLLDMREWLFKTRQRELISASGVGVQVSPMLLPPAPRVGVLPTLRNGIKEGTLPFTIALEEGETLKSNAVGRPDAPEGPTNLGELGLFDKGVTDLVPPVEPYPPASVVLKQLEVPDAPKQPSQVSASDPNADLLNAIQQLMRDAQPPKASKNSITPTTDKNPSTGSQICPTGDCSESSSQSSGYVTADTSEDPAHTDPLTGKSTDANARVDPVQAALDRANRVEEQAKQEAQAALPKTPAPTPAPPDPMIAVMAKAAAHALEVRAELAGSKGPYKPPVFNADHAWDWTGPSTSETYNNNADLCENGEEDCDTVETVPKGWLDALVELKSNTKAVEPPVTNTISNNVAGSSDGVKVENHIKAPGAGDPIPAANNIKNSVADSTPDHVNNDIHHDPKRAPPVPQNSDNIDNTVSNSQAFKIHNHIHNTASNAKTQISNSLTGFKDGQVVNALNPKGKF